MCRKTQLKDLINAGRPHGRQVTMFPRNGGSFTGTIERVNSTHGSALLRTDTGIRSVMLHTPAKSGRQ